ncbi:uncharacterized protein C8Q71DRAFT_751839 [Rhodofomes roseus]|uniref:Uncharacterized protein n=1 Tax=Rhodofomes roseus TaxID=34475 RepID=A0ABQ8KKW8_9APHY|nr:uncharacterized protein C8Q71DRAFT_751839 [Rhodofomes roseus]KAH9838560.1 hypothetical protein C8Q71DRAFT_751839 [Rhodofomes roseus]
MMERLAARGLHIQRAPKHAEMVTMISEFAVHLANEAPLSSSRSITMADCVVHDQNTVQSTIGALVPMESVQMELASRSFLSDMDTTLVDVDMRMATPYKAAGPVGTQTPYHWMSQQLPVTPSVHSSYMPHLQPSSMSVDQLAQVPFSPQKHQSTPFMNGPRKYSETEADTRFRVLDNFDTPTPKGRLGHLQAISESRSFGSLYDEAEEAQVQEMLFGALGVNQAVALALAT